MATQKTESKSTEPAQTPKAAPQKKTKTATAKTESKSDTSSKKTATKAATTKSTTPKTASKKTTQTGTPKTTPTKAAPKPTAKPTTAKPEPKSPPPVKTKSPTPTPAPTPNDAQVWRVRIMCVAGPSWDPDGTDVCMRAIDILNTSSLYDLHTAILEAVHFEEHDESVFSFFNAMDFRGHRTYLGDGKPLSAETDISRFEEITIARSIPTARSSQYLYYTFDADDRWVFLVSREANTRAPSPHEFYPLVRDELNRGPDPIQFGDGLDDFADMDEGEEFNQLRNEFRKRRRTQEESGLDDDDFDDLTDNVNDLFSRDDDSSGFFGGDDEENFDPYSSGYGRDEW